MLWDIFCKVIDNHGDVGVCWRLSSQLAARGEQVRLWIDDASAMPWMAPHGHPGVQVLDWDAQARSPNPGDVVIEAFGCELATPFQAAIAAKAKAIGRQPAWINLEYLTAESFAERAHRLPSPVLSGPAAGLTKHFFYPGFTSATGGLLREQDLMQRQAKFDRKAWLRGQHIDVEDGVQLISLFCYEPAALDQLLSNLKSGPVATHLLVTAGRATAAVQAALARLQGRKAQGQAVRNDDDRLSITFLPLLSQLDYDHLLWACDLNFVRGEDSLVRALWAGKALVWHIYPQQDRAHEFKLSAFLDWLDAPESLRSLHRAWNSASSQPLPQLEIEVWTACVRAGRESVLLQDDLAAQLMNFLN